MIRTARRLALLFALFTIAAPPVRAAEPPRLVVVISIDQFRYEYLERFAPWYGEGGFRRFLERGANFDNAFYRHATTFTGPGHASIGTGRTPSENGIIGNTWFDRTLEDDASWDWFFEDAGGYDAPAHPAAPPDARPWYEGHGSPRYCVYDARTNVSAGKTTGMSPASLSEDSLGDRLRQRYPDAKVIAVALKDRAAILMGGRRADAAYWFDNKLPGFISSSWYRYDPALFDFNAKVPSYIPASGVWSLSGLIPAEDLKRVTFDPPEAWKLKNPRYETHFDHPIKDARALTYSPYGNDLLLDFAQSVVEREKLGSDPAHPDLFFVGLSTPDYLGHYYGPDSMEVADDAVRLDRSLARFLGALERTYGDRLLVAITADHGVQSTPEIAKLRDPKIDAGRVDLRNPVKTAHFISELPPLRIELERAVAKKLNLKFDPNAPLSQTLVFFFEEPSLYLNWERIADLKLDGERVKRAVRDVLMTWRGRGVDRAFTNTELLSTNPNASDLERQVRLSFRADRSGDVLITLKKNWIWSYSATNTTHGQPLPDDQHVPMLLWGAGVKAGRYHERVAPTDLARTLGALFGVTVGATDSRLLPCLDVREESAELRGILTSLMARFDAQGGAKTYIPGSQLATSVRTALAAMPHSAAAAPESAETTLPANYARVDFVEVNGDSARARVWVGPIVKAKEGELLAACGTGYTVSLKRQADGTWTIEGPMGVAMC